MVYVYLLVMLHALWRLCHPLCVSCQARGLQVLATTRNHHPRWAMRFPFCERCAAEHARGDCACAS